MEEALNDYIDQQNREYNMIREEVRFNKKQNTQVLRCERAFQDNRTSRETRLTTHQSELEEAQEEIETLMSNEKIVYF